MLLLRYNFNDFNHFVTLTSTRLISEDAVYAVKHVAVLTMYKLLLIYIYIYIYIYIQGPPKNVYTL